MIFLLVVVLGTSYYLGVVTLTRDTAGPYHRETHRTSPHTKNVGYDVRWAEYKFSRGLHSASPSPNSKRVVPIRHVTPLHLHAMPQVDRNAVDENQTVKHLLPTESSVFQRASEQMKTHSFKAAVGPDPSALQPSVSSQQHSYRKKLFSDNRPIQSVTVATPSSEVSHRGYAVPCFGHFCAGSLEPADQQRVLSQVGTCSDAVSL